MSKTVFSADLFEQLGGVNWLSRPGHFEAVPAVTRNPVEESDETLSLSEVSMEAVSQFEPDLSVPLGVGASSSVGYDSLNDKQELAEVPDKIMRYESGTLSEDKRGGHGNVVLLGAGLDAVWQNEANQAWQLWQNIMLAFGWDETQMAFFDTQNLVSEEVVFATMEEVIELGVDWVLTMDEEHPISEQLVEGVHVVSVPDLESMLSDPYSKQSFYQAVIAVNASH